MIVEGIPGLAEKMFDLSTEYVKELARAHNLTRERFVSYMENDRVYGIQLDGKIAGVISCGRGQVHVAVEPWAKGRWLRDLEKVLRQEMPPWKELLATVDAKDINARMFIERCGCELAFENSDYALYRVKESKMWYQRRRNGKSN